MDFKVFLDIFENLFKNVGQFWNWFITPLNLGGTLIAPISLFSIGGIIIFIGIAILLWVFK